MPKKIDNDVKETAKKYFNEGRKNQAILALVLIDTGKVLRGSTLSTWKKSWENEALVESGNYDQFANRIINTSKKIDEHVILTYSDIADIYGVNKSNVKVAFNENRTEWQDKGSLDSFPPLETFKMDMQTPGGVQSLRVFTLKGAWRFCYHIKSGLAKYARDLLLVYWVEKKEEPIPQIAEFKPTEEVAPINTANNFMMQYMEAMGHDVIGHKAQIESLINKVDNIEELNKKEIARQIEANDKRKKKEKDEEKTGQAELHKIIHLLVSNSMKLPIGHHYRYRNTDQAYANFWPMARKCIEITGRKISEKKDFDLQLLPIAIPHMSKVLKDICRDAKTEYPLPTQLSIIYGGKE